MESVREPITVMQRYEWKYIMNAEQTDFFCDQLKDHMEPDAYGLTTISSLYYDTPDHQLIRVSIEKPEFKEKIRLRAYGSASLDTPVFLELKRKAYGIVYKRRVQATIPEAERFFAGELDLDQGGQIDREITYFRNYYRRLIPSCMILYDRTAYYEPGGDLRLTIDRNPRWRTEALSFLHAPVGIPLLDPGEAILEIKVQDTENRVCFYHGYKSITSAALKTIYKPKPRNTSGQSFDTPLGKEPLNGGLYLYSITSEGRLKHVIPPFPLRSLSLQHWQYAG